MQTLLTHLMNSLSSQFVGGGLVLMFTGSLIALLRQMPGRIWTGVKNRFRYVVTVDSRDPLFDFVTYWLDSQERFKKSRLLKATTRLHMETGNGPAEVCSSSGDRKKAPRVFYSPSAGRHFIRRGQAWVAISKGSPGQPANTGGQQNNGQFNFTPEEYTFEAFGKTDGHELRELIQEIVAFGSQDTEGIRVYYSVWGHWSSNGTMQMRPLDTVVLPKESASELLEDVLDFRSRQAWYRDLGIPWHRGYLLWGLPGTGKSSLAAALAGHLGMDLYLLNLAGNGMSDENLMRLMADVRPGCMVLLEDIDCTVPDRESEVKPNRVTLSGLLNCLDGIMSREGCIIVMTTNRRESLDDALVRPGRVDFEMEFGYATREQIARLAGAIGVSAEGLAGDSMTMAEVQKELIGRYDRRRQFDNNRALSEVIL